MISLSDFRLILDFFQDITKTTEAESSLEGKLSATLSYGSVKVEANVQASSTSKTSSKTRLITSTMKIERYYSSLKEESSPLSDDAAALLDAEDYVGFFKACGPNYTRGIRRAQEVTAIFKFETSSSEKAKQFSAGLKVAARGIGVDASFAGKSKFKEVTSSLSIKIIGFGLGLSQEGSETLVATSLQEYNEVMKFSFNTMTKNEDAYNIGMIYGIEVVPWVHNTAFQVAAKMQEENILLPLPRSLIPKAYRKDGKAAPKFNKDNRDDFRCKDLSFVVDKFGYCCEKDALYSIAEGKYDPEDLITTVCRPQRSLDKALLKDNMVNNGEFVARLDDAMRYRLIQLSVAEKCISAANSFPARFDFNFLKAQDTVKYDRAIETKMTLFDMKKAIDPLGNFGIVKHMSEELDEWIEMFYSPCMAALYGTNIGTTPDTDISFFMAYPWHAHTECLRLSCLTPNMRWDRKNGGCIPGLITGAKDTEALDQNVYKAGEDSQCAKDPEENEGATEVCKKDQGELRDYHKKATDCWRKKFGSGSIDYFINHFCNPQLTGDKATKKQRNDMIQEAIDSCEYTGPHAVEP